MAVTQFRETMTYSIVYSDDNVVYSYDPNPIGN
jgi:hypothetical protein